MKQSSIADAPAVSTQGSPALKCGSHVPLILSGVLLALLIGCGSHLPAASPPRPRATPEQAAHDHYIRLKVISVTPLAETARYRLLKLEVERWYGKIEKEAWDRAQEHETQTFTILFPASPGATVEVGNIIDYRLERLLSGPLVTRAGQRVQ